MKNNNIILNSIKIGAMIFTLEENSRKGEFLACNWDTENELEVDRCVSKWETAGGAAQELLNIIEYHLDTPK